MRGLINLFVQYNPRLGRIGDSGKTDCLQCPLTVNKHIAKLLDEIPSETSARERRFLYIFFSTIWSGEKDVIEVGPFLGGTTRAIALGMCANPKVTEKSMLLTFDRFYGYYDLQRLAEYLAPLVSTGVLQQSDIDALGEAAEFMDIFDRLHSGHEYYNRITAFNQQLPDKPEDLHKEKLFLQIPDNTLSDAVFIDGCKSWFGTKYFMTEVCKAARTGTYFIFQDYGWYTCFWLPAFIELLKDFFQIIGYVDTTYVFMLRKPLNSDEIGMQYPDKPFELGEERVIAIFDSLIKWALDRSDHFAVIRHSLQCAGALAYLGNKRKAKAMISELKNNPWAAGHKKIIDRALCSPTYSPDGPIYL